MSQEAGKGDRRKRADIYQLSVASQTAHPFWEAGSTAPALPSRQEWRLTELTSIVWSYKTNGNPAAMMVLYTATTDRTFNCMLLSCVSVSVCSLRFHCCDKHRDQTKLWGERVISAYSCIPLWRRSQGRNLETELMQGPHRRWSLQACTSHLAPPAFLQNLGPSAQVWHHLQWLGALPH